MMPNVGPRVPIYPPGSPGMGQQIFYGQAPTFVPPQMLGENLYPLVKQHERDHAAKVRGMLLEMDKPEVLHLLESPEALKAEVTEAMEVLRNVARQQGSAPRDQLAA